MAGGLADTDRPATGTTSVIEWVGANGEYLRHHYANEIERHFRR